MPKTSTYQARASKKYREANREKYKTYSKNYYQNNKESIKTKNKIAYQLKKAEIVVL